MQKKALYTATAHDATVRHSILEISQYLVGLHIRLQQLTLQLIMYPKRVAPGSTVGSSTVGGVLRATLLQHKIKTEPTVESWSFEKVRKKTRSGQNFIFFFITDISTLPSDSADGVQYSFIAQ